METEPTERRTGQSWERAAHVFRKDEASRVLGRARRETVGTALWAQDARPRAAEVRHVLVRHTS